MAGNALVIEHIEKYFPVPQTGVRAFLNPFAALTHPALLGISFQVGAGEVACLIGANGSGKSTLLRILATLLVPTRGRARVAGYDVEQQASQVRSQLGFHSATDGGFYSRLTARENLNFFAAMNNLFDAEAARRLEELTELMGIGGFLESQVRTLSTGQVHRLALARAMIHRPSVLLLDEPTRSLDPMAAAEFRRFLKTQLVDRHGTTVLFASHTLAEVEQLADRVILLDKGRLVSCDSPRGLRDATGSATLEEALERLTPHGSRVEVRS
ncbi:MAG TPA: ABC transporter ATP-binding protein [Terriglobales bacterium]|nr:ABC transporter ATP-binding protein [Terriglobales bacterium]